MPRSRSRRTVLAVALAALACLVAAACGEDENRAGGGGDSSLTEPTGATLVLDFVPNAVHTGIYCALADGRYEDNNLELEIVEPTSIVPLATPTSSKAFPVAPPIDVLAPIVAWVIALPVTPAPRGRFRPRPGRR